MNIVTIKGNDDYYFILVHRSVQRPSLLPFLVLSVSEKLRTGFSFLLLPPFKPYIILENGNASGR